jgi:hypothetical protein
MQNSNWEFKDLDENQRKLRLAEREIYRQSLAEAQRKLKRLQKWVDLLQERTRRQARKIQKIEFSAGRNFNSTIGG